MTKSKTEASLKSHQTTEKKKALMQDHQKLLEEIKNTIQDCSINFLFGSGMSMPFLSTLGKIEIFLTQLAQKKDKGEVSIEVEKIVRVSLYKRFFDVAISKNFNLLDVNDDSNKVLENYKKFLKTINSILLNRKSTILNKQLNIFTTNVDIFLEKSLESTSVEYNDGFCGRFSPIFNLSNFKKSFFKTSLHYDNISELPVFNLMKLHGSLTWLKTTTEEIRFSSDLKIVEQVKSNNIDDSMLISIDIDDDDTTLDDLISAANGKIPDKTVDDFIEAYEKLAIVNPTKEKFKETVLNRNYYELLRIYSNELEKENTVLFVTGFSFADEHIRDVTVRVANSNPTLKIIIFSHSSDIDEGVRILKESSINSNIQVISPSQKESDSGVMKDEFSYNFDTLNNMIFSELLKKIIGGNKASAKHE